MTTVESYDSKFAPAQAIVTNSFFSIRIRRGERYAARYEANKVIKFESQLRTEHGTCCVEDEIGGRRDPRRTKKLIGLNAERSCQAYQRGKQKWSLDTGNKAPYHQVTNRNERQEIGECLCDSGARKGDPLNILPMRRAVGFSPGQADDQQYRRQPKHKQYSPDRPDHIFPNVKDS